MARDRVRRTRFARQTVFEHEGGNAVLAEPFGHPVTLMRNPEFAMASTWGHYDGSPGGFAFGRKVDRDGRAMHAGNNLIVLLHPDFFVAGFAFGTGSVAGPKHYAGRSEERRVGKECSSRWSP